MRRSDEPVHHRGNIYKYRYFYKGKLRWKYCVETFCRICGCKFYADRSNYNKDRGNLCGKKCIKVAFSGENNIAFKGKKLKGGGHVLVYNPDHPGATKHYIPEHRLVVEKHIGRYLLANEFVHHINMDKADNRIENLMVFTSNTKHFRAHGSLNACVKSLMEAGVLVFSQETGVYSVAAELGSQKTAERI